MFWMIRSDKSDLREIRSCVDTGRVDGRVDTVYPKRDGKQQDHKGRGAEGCDHNQLDPHRDQSFHGMKAEVGRCVNVEIAMMHPVQAPQPRHCMENHMLQVYHEIKQRHRDDDGGPERGGQPWSRAMTTRPPAQPPL